MPTLYEEGDSLHGYRITIRARRLGKPKVIAFSGRHRTQMIVAQDDVHCVIDMPLKRPKPKT